MRRPELPAENLPRRLMTRGLVIASCLLWLLLASPFPASLDGWGTGLVLGLLVIWIFLGATTGWLAFGRTARLDEFRLELRDRS